LGLHGNKDRDRDNVKDIIHGSRIEWIFNDHIIRIIFKEIIIQTCQKSIAGIVMLEIQPFVKNMEDRQVVDETKESFLDIEKTVDIGFWSD